MKNYKYIALFLLSLGVISCDVNNELDAIPAEAVENVALNTNGLDFSNYVSVGASFTAGYTDGAMFIAAQENSFPNILAGIFGTEFKQPLMNDNIGGLVYGGAAVQPPRFYFDGAGPARLPATPTTELTAVLSGPFNNFGAPGAKSFHLGVPGYGQLNPYFGRMASSPTATVLGDALAQNPTFFTLSEIGGNDVLGYALSGGSGVDRSPNTAENLNPANYGGNDITNPNVFAQVFSDMVTALTANGAKGVVANVPYITDLANFITIPYNPIPMDAATAGAVSSAYAQYNGGIQQAFAYLVAVTPMTQEMANAEIAKRTISFTAGQNAVVIMDEDLTDLTAINPGLISMRQATSDDLLVLASSAIIGTLADPSNPASVNGVGVPLADQWALTPQEQASIRTATDAYNTTIATVAASNPNVALVDFKGVLTEASTGIMFDNYTMTTSLVTGGLVSLDGVHLTARGYALMANKILASIDVEFGSNFTTATNGLAKAGDYPTNYSPLLR
ncbi:MAG: G-D-S-L family lipolytic protein [Polaribacter sp.]|uniref:G-D-S-L family lipolytic protein n=1 Tax=Polaribacter sp. TaxID=1920175 RepID=UPI002628727D|nr:G-D-S-L family lipolytic protein [Polaribacter sp.]MDG1194772.1 G-D-S-L family lipolytic protein [Polaribacter sp.]MDG1403964.1 G-D-S-L family lipolytic protein [Polaribacter sp.]MDG2436040.1 G-D-S-L family lipolytic protein [Polaribacter sp.]